MIHKFFKKVWKIKQQKFVKISKQTLKTNVFSLKTQKFKQFPPEQNEKK